MAPSDPLPPLPPPVLVNIESTLGCNLECVMCGSHLSGVTRLRRSMAPALLARIEEEVLPGVVDLSLTVAGEPFMTPKLGDFVAVAERGGHWLQLNSNATLLKDSKLLRRILAQSGSIRFSVDGARPETYAAIRGQDALATVQANIAMAVRVRAELPPDQRPRLALCMVLMRRNVDELVEMVEMARDLGVDQLEVAHLTVLTPEMDGESLRHDPDRCDAMLRAARVRADQLGLRLVLPPPMQGRPVAPRPSARLRLALRELRQARPRRLGASAGGACTACAWPPGSCGPAGGCPVISCKAASSSPLAAMWPPAPCRGAPSPATCTSRASPRSGMARC